MAKLLCTEDEYTRIQKTFPESYSLLKRMNKQGISFHVDVVDTLARVPENYQYDTETTEYLVYRNKYTGDEIHIPKDPQVFMLDRTPEVKDITPNKKDPDLTRQPNSYTKMIRRIGHLPVGSIFQLGRYQYLKTAAHRMTDRNDVDTLGPNAINLENGHQVALLTYLKVRVLNI